MIFLLSFFGATAVYTAVALLSSAATISFFAVTICVLFSCCLTPRSTGVVRNDKGCSNDQVVTWLPRLSRSISLLFPGFLRVPLLACTSLALRPSLSGLSSIFLAAVMLVVFFYYRLFLLHNARLCVPDGAPIVNLRNQRRLLASSLALQQTTIVKYL